ncbi:MAG: thiamine phosphate synthase [Clostridium sp.]
MKCDEKDMRLYAVTDRTWLGEKTLAMQVEEALKGGVTCVQLREKELDEEAFLAEAITIGELCRSYHVPFLINDNVSVTLQSGADGIHIGQHDMDASDIRRMIGNDKILGVSAQTVPQAVKAQQDGADYLGVGAVFSTSTKLDANAVSHEVVKEISEAVSIPIVAIGGINKQNIMQLQGTGVDGVALVSGIFAGEDIEDECKKLRKLSEEMVTGGDL